MRRQLLGANQGFIERAVLGFVHGRVQVVFAALAVARGAKQALHAQRLGVHNGADGVVEGKVFGAGEGFELASQSVGGEWAGGDKRGAAPPSGIQTSLGQSAELFAPDFDSRIAFQSLRHRLGEAVTVNRERRAAGHRILVGKPDEQGAGAAQLLLEQPRGRLRRVGLKGI